MAKEFFWHFLFLPCYLYDKKDDEESIDKDRLIDLVKRTSAADITEARVKKKVGLVMVTHIVHYWILSRRANAPETLMLDTVIDCEFTGSWYMSQTTHTHTHTHTHQGKRDC